MFVLAFFLLPLALSTRVVILLHGAKGYPQWVAWAVLLILVGSGLFVQNAVWVIVTKRTFDVRMKDFPLFNAGLLGLFLSRAQLDTPEQRPVPYFD